MSIVRINVGTIKLTGRSVFFFIIINKIPVVTYRPLGNL